MPVFVNLPARRKAAQKAKEEAAQKASKGEGQPRPVKKGKGDA